MVQLSGTDAAKRITGIGPGPVWCCPVSRSPSASSPPTVVLISLSEAAAQDTSVGILYLSRFS